MMWCTDPVATLAEGAPDDTITGVPVVVGSVVTVVPAGCRFAHPAASSRSVAPTTVTYGFACFMLASSRRPSSSDEPARRVQRQTLEDAEGARRDWLGYPAGRHRRAVQWQGQRTDRAAGPPSSRTTSHRRTAAVLSRFARSVNRNEERRILRSAFTSGVAAL